jgi:peptidyl-tRNA hydrolase, PTH1 family
MEAPIEPGTSRVRIILGLGNPGPEYQDTRHNVGFQVVEELARRRRLELSGRECRCLLARDGDLILAMPQTYMNRSGYSAWCLCERFTVDPADLLVVLDDVALPLGTLRLRGRGSPGGHRGMESILESLRSAEVPRLRLGIREGEEPPSGDELVDFVLSPFPPERREEVYDMVRRSADACESWLEAGLEATMNLYNG